MKYCTKCGNQIADESTFCPVCGAQVAAPQAAPQVAPQVAPQQPEQPYAQPQQPAYYAPVYEESGLTKAAKIFMIIGTVAMGLMTYCFGLAWCIPMTVVYFKKLKNRQPIGTGFKVCTLLFVNTIAGILMLCDKDN